VPSFLTDESPPDQIDALSRHESETGRIAKVSALVSRMILVASASLRAGKRVTDVSRDKAPKRSHCMAASCSARSIERDAPCLDKAAGTQCNLSRPASINAVNSARDGLTSASFFDSLNIFLVPSNIFRWRVHACKRARITIVLFRYGQRHQRPSGIRISELAHLSYWGNECSTCSMKKLKS
jgi:hypothetical protein